MTKRARKPSSFNITCGHTGKKVEFASLVSGGGLRHIAITHYDLKYLKKFHKWLGRAIVYLEQGKK